MLVEEVEWFDTEHPGNANDSNNHKNHMKVALEWREYIMYIKYMYTVCKL